MSKFNRPSTRPAVSSPIMTEPAPTGTTYEGAAAYARDPRSELFLLSVVNMVGEGSFYEQAGDRDARFAELVRKVAVEDPVWLFQMLRWLRTEGNMRSAPIVAACETVHAILNSGNTQHPAYEIPGLTDDRGLPRALVDAVCQRADEPGELLAYWTSRYGRAIPKPVKRGLADAVQRLYNQRSLLKYDTDTRGFRFGDVIDLVHPSPATGKAWQGDLFKHALDRRHGRDETIPESLAVLRARRELMALPVAERRAFLSRPDADGELRAAGMTWEALAGWLQGPMDATAWETVIPSMGYMALLRNLRNFDEAGVSDEVAERVAARIADPDEVARSRQFPYRFLSAYMAVSSDRWREPLRRALQHSVQNVPALPGRTLVLVDTSASMASYSLSARSSVNAMMAGALFGAALAAKGEAVDLHGFADGRPFRHPVSKGASVLRETERFVARCGEDGHGTRIATSVRATFKRHDRVIVVTDMQTFGDGYYGYRDDGAVDVAAPAHVPMYAFNLGGYRHTPMPSGRGTRHEMGGLTDATFRMIPLLESGRNANWPWL